MLRSTVYRVNENSKAEQPEDVNRSRFLFYNLIYVFTMYQRCKVPHRPNAITKLSERYFALCYWNGIRLKARRCCAAMFSKPRCCSSWRTYNTMLQNRCCNTPWEKFTPAHVPHLDARTLSSSSFIVDDVTRWHDHGSDTCMYVIYQ